MFSSTTSASCIQSTITHYNCPEQSIQKRTLSASWPQPVPPHPTNSPEMYTFSSILPQPAASSPLSHPINCPEQFISEGHSLLPGFNKTQHQSSREFVRGFSGCHMPTDRRTYQYGYGKRCSSTFFVVNMPISILNGNLRQTWSVVKNVLYRSQCRGMKRTMSDGLIQRNGALRVYWGRNWFLYCHYLHKLRNPKIIYSGISKVCL